MAAQPHGRSHDALPLAGNRRPSWRARSFYIAGVLLVAGAIGAGVLFSAIDPPGGGNNDNSDAAITNDDRPGDASSAAEDRANANGNDASPTATSTEEAAALQYAAPEQVIDPSKSYTAVLKTEKGDITIKLRPDLAPKHVNSFVFLARQGYYDGVTFHRVIPGFVAQAGDPTGTGSGGPGYTIPAEFGTEPFVAGAIGAARANDPNSAGSQFFITLDDAPHLNGQYTVFGEVTEGMDVALRITPTDGGGAPDKILTVEIIES